MRAAAVLLAVLASAISARADDGLGLRRGGDRNAVSVSGLSSGAAMAVQYAVAHSATVTGVGSVAGPLWGCAGGALSRAVNDCLCARHPLPQEVETARGLAAAGRIDGLDGGRPRALARAYVFQSPVDETVSAVSGAANAGFLGSFIGTPATLDRGEPGDGSDHAGHGILSPDGSDACAADGREGSYNRRCGAADNAGRIFRTLYGDGTGEGRTALVPESEIWSFDQGRIIDAVTARGAPVAYDSYSLTWLGWRNRSRRRDDLDMARRAYLYVPPACRATGSACRVHVALHGCKQDARTFAREAGYNNWAEHYRAIVVYPAIAPGVPVSGAACRLPALDPALVDATRIGPNPNGCWDWWGYLDDVAEAGRYLTRDAPQMRVLTGIIAAVTAPRD